MSSILLLFLPVILCIKILMFPVLPSGPTIIKAVERKPSDQRELNQIVKQIKIANFVKKIIVHPNRKTPEPKVVTAPAKIVMPIDFNACVVLYIRVSSLPYFI
mmetsp:Transcript_35365/g.61757  ORF Transcript_35365/g.61757 Transcript_35365/m.61757 type:complete len:103 (-) Transcript_35365:132-440(-)